MYSTMHVINIYFLHFLKCIQIFSCQALSFMLTDFSHLNCSGDYAFSYCSFRYEYDLPSISSLCAILLVVSCLNPITICCILLFLFILSFHACSTCLKFQIVKDDSIEINGLEVNNFSIALISSKVLWA